MPDTTRVLKLLAGENPVPREAAAAHAAHFDVEAGIARAIESGSSVPRGRRVAQPRATLPAGLAVLLVAVASAFALTGRPTIDFWNAKKAPRWAFFTFERGRVFNAFMTGTRNPPVALAGAARQITTVEYQGRDHLLVVAPVKGGGFCDSWRGPYLSGSCVLSRAAVQGKIETSLPGDGSGPIALYGSFTETGGARLEVTFADGTTAKIPAVWVSPPISAGFFLYKVPSAQRSPGHVPTTLSLLDGSGHVIARTTLPLFRKRPPARRVPGFGLVVAPRQAVYSRRRLLFHVTATTIVPAVGQLKTHHSHQVGLWVAPERSGGTCFWTGSIGGGRTSGCEAEPSRAALPIAPDFYEDTLCCQVGTDVARIELRFQDGDRLELRPNHGFILASIPLRHFTRGHRLEQEIAYSRSGKVLADRRIPTNRAGMYPCTKPRVVKEGVRICR